MAHFWHFLSKNCSTNTTILWSLILIVDKKIAHKTIDLLGQTLRWRASSGSKKAWDSFVLRIKLTNLACCNNRCSSRCHNILTKSDYLYITKNNKLTSNIVAPSSPSSPVLSAIRFFFIIMSMYPPINCPIFSPSNV